MQGIWIFSEDNAVAKQLLTAGLDLKGAMPQPVGVITLDATAPKELIASGADKVVVLNGQSSRPEDCSEVINQIIVEEDAGALLIGGTLRGKDLAAQIAVSWDAGLVTDAQSVKADQDALETTRLTYGGLAICTERVMLPAVLTIPPRNYDEAQPEEGRQGDVRTVELGTYDSRIVIRETKVLDKQGVDITSAEKVVCVGRGIAKEEDLKLAENLGQILGAEIACTRPIVEDYKWLPEGIYIGISGQKIKPDLYVGLGVSGQVQHVAGIRDSRIIVAIDTNENAPIFGAADYGIVGDMYEVVPLLTEALAQK